MLGYPFSKYMKLINNFQPSKGSFKLELKAVIEIENITNCYNYVKESISRMHI